MTLSRKIDAILPLVSKPTRYLGNEFNVVRKTVRPGMAQWCLIFPEVYEIGMSHMGLRILYHILNSRPDAVAERAYAPWFDMEAQMRRQGIPLFSLESRRPVREFDLVGFSLQYELTYTNLLNCLDLAGIPLKAEDRGENDPLILAGGPCVSNPEPLSDFIDLFLIGDGEETVPLIHQAILGLKGRPRQEKMQVLASIPGVYAPSYYDAAYDADGRFQTLQPRFPNVPERIQRQYVRDLETAPWPERPLVPIQDIVQNRLSLEVLRGCTQGCRFCQAGYLYRPVRERSAGKILELADQGIRNSGWDEVGLVSLSTADHTQLEAMAELLNARFVSDTVAISLPSLRADAFGVGIADKVRETRRTGFTFAPESGSERLRLAMNKNIRDEEFFAAAHTAYSRGWRLIKIYFMIGLPTETWEDVEKIAAFVDTVRNIGRQYGPSCMVHASVGAFVPKSHTPFQWDRFEDRASLGDKLAYLQRTVPSRWSRLKWHSIPPSHLEAIFSLGDRRLGPVLARAFARGARFDGWTESFRYDTWLAALEECGVDPEVYTRGRPLDAPLPWDHIDIGVRKQWLARERKKTDAQEFVLGQSLVADCRHGDCTACGIPGLPNDIRLAPKLTEDDVEAMKKEAKSLAPVPSPAAVSWPTRMTYEKRASARFLAHLEMTEVFARAFRMARVPLAYSRGFRPHPRLSFGPPLSVGLEALAEGFDAELLQPWSQAMHESLNAVLPEGLKILRGTPLSTVPGIRRLSIHAAGRRACYAIDLGELSEEELARCAEAARSFAQNESWVVPRSYWIPDGSPGVPSWEAPLEGEMERKIEGKIDGNMAGKIEEKIDGSADAKIERKPDRGLRNDRGPKGHKDEPRRVDLKRAIFRMQFLSPTQIDLDLYLEHPEGHTANPRVVMEQLFHLAPEQQSRISITRLALLTAEGVPLLS